MKKIFIALMAFVSMSVSASEDWFLLSTSFDKQYKIEGQKGSFVEGDNTGSIVIRSTLKGKSPRFNIVFVTKTDCKAGFGSVHYYNTDSTFDSKFQYVSNGGTNAQNVGDMICALLKQSSV